MARDAVARVMRCDSGAACQHIRALLPAMRRCQKMLLSLMPIAAMALSRFA